MKYTSTRGEYTASSAQAIAYGIAPNGGLYTPIEIPRLTLKELDAMRDLSYSGLAAEILSRFLGDFTKEELSSLAGAAYDTGRFLRPGSDAREAVGFLPLGKDEDLLALYYGPTAAFKDMALQIMPRLLTASLRKLEETRTVCILVATSGDTGKAALEGFRDVEGTRIGVYYPDGGVSEIQRTQMRTQEGSNVRVWAVRGNFDDCQTGVKRIFGDESVREALAKENTILSSANSINWGRLAPQIVYYFWSYLEMLRRGEIRLGDRIHFCVPTGNFGNILAGFLAKRMGLPIDRLICASNANNVLTDFIRTGVYDRTRPFYRTLSPSMDILISSNVERLLYYLEGGDCARVAEKMRLLSETGRYTLEGKALEELQETFCAGYCGDDATSRTINEVYAESGTLIDTHTAVAVRVKRDLAIEGKTVLVSTASAYKFADGVLPALGQEKADGFDAIDRLAAYTGAPIPAPLDGLRGKQARFTQVVDREEMPAAALAFCRE